MQRYKLVSYHNTRNIFGKNDACALLKASREPIHSCISYRDLEDATWCKLAKLRSLIYPHHFRTCHQFVYYIYTHYSQTHAVTHVNWLNLINRMYQILFIDTSIQLPLSLSTATTKGSEQEMQPRCLSLEVLYYLNALHLFVLMYATGWRWYLRERKKTFTRAPGQINFCGSLASAHWIFF